MMRTERDMALLLVLEHAERSPGAGLPYESLPQVRRAFGNRRELLLALQQAWSLALWSRIEAHAVPSRRHRPNRLTDLTGLAWAESTEQHPILRQLLDRYGEELGAPPVLATA